ncbi:hypothetical protein ACIQNU_04365 [Streptomyces sp. NPDC091292]|uniref:hypothetical protein n=1 Tax=Streptomyces sp. NPDC091292 TaxID=3365991 RepID=UPI0037FEE26C
MTNLHIPADDLRIGDIIIHDDGETTVRELDRTPSGTIVTNPGSTDQITGYLWQHVKVRRAE